jgi:hypothetical protein
MAAQPGNAVAVSDGLCEAAVGVSAGT